MHTRPWLWYGIFSLVVCLALAGLVCGNRAAHAQASYELACPTGSTPLNQTFNPSTGKYRAYICADANGTVTFPSLSPSGTATSLPFGNDTGAVNAYVVSTTPSFSTLTQGMTAINWKTTTANTGPSTLNVNGTGVKTLYGGDGVALASGNILSGVMYGAVYDGTNWILNGIGATPANTLNLTGLVTLVTPDTSTGFQTSRHWTWANSNPSASRVKAIVVVNSNPGGTSAEGFIGNDNDGVPVFGGNSSWSFLGGVNQADQSFRQFTFLENHTFTGNDVDINPGLTKTGGNALRVQNGGGPPVLFNVDSVTGRPGGANCTSSASPAVCGANWAGSVVIAAGSTAVTVNTTAVTANSQILVTQDAGLGSKLSVTCNTTLTTILVTTRVAGTSFSVGASSAPATNPLCLSYQINN